MNAWAKFFIAIALLPVGALFGAWVYSELWHYLLAPQYGQGPSYESWFGISCIWGLLTQAMIPDKKNEKETVSDFFADVIVSYVKRLFALGLALFVRAVLGWA